MIITAPQELQHYILLFLNNKDQAIASRVCKLWNALCNEFPYFKFGAAFISSDTKFEQIKIKHLFGFNFLRPNEQSIKCINPQMTCIYRDSDYHIFPFNAQEVILNKADYPKIEFNATNRASSSLVFENSLYISGFVREIEKSFVVFCATLESDNTLTTNCYDYGNEVKVPYREDANTLPLTILKSVDTKKDIIRTGFTLKGTSFFMISLDKGQSQGPIQSYGINEKLSTLSLDKYYITTDLFGDKLILKKFNRSPDIECPEKLMTLDEVWPFNTSHGEGFILNSKHGADLQLTIFYNEKKITSLLIKKPKSLCFHSLIALSTKSTFFILTKYIENATTIQSQLNTYRYDKAPSNQSIWEHHFPPCQVLNTIKMIPFDKYEQETVLILHANALSIVAPRRILKTIELPTEYQYEDISLSGDAIILQHQSGFTLLNFKRWA